MKEPTLQPTNSKRKTSTVIESIDLTQQEKKRKTEYALSGPRDYQDLHKLHKSVQKKEIPSSLHSVVEKQPKYSYNEAGDHQLSFLDQSSAERRTSSSEYGNLDIENMISRRTSISNHDNERSFPGLEDRNKAISRGSEIFDDNDSMFSEAIVGLADSQELQMTSPCDSSKLQHDRTQGAPIFNKEPAEADLALEFSPAITAVSPKHTPRESAQSQHKAEAMPVRAPFFEATSSPEASRWRSDLHDRDIVRVDEAAPVAKEEHHNLYGEILNLLDMPVANDKESSEPKDHYGATKQTQQPIETKQKDPKTTLRDFNDLQPWLLQEFGNIVELVDE